MLKKRVVRISLILGILVLVIGLIFASHYSPNRMFTKDFILDVSTNDYELDHNTVLNPSEEYRNLRLLSEDERKKLAAYMKEKKYVVIEGKYTINPEDSLVKIKMNLKFKKKN